MELTSFPQRSDIAKLSCPPPAPGLPHSSRSHNGSTNRVEATGENVVVTLVGQVLGNPSYEGGMYCLRHNDYRWLETGVFHSVHTTRHDFTERGGYHWAAPISGSGKATSVYNGKHSFRVSSMQNDTNRTRWDAGSGQE